MIIYQIKTKFSNELMDIVCCCDCIHYSTNNQDCIDVDLTLQQYREFVKNLLLFYQKVVFVTYGVM